MKQFIDELIYRYKNVNGDDITSAIRGKIFVLDQVLHLKDVLESPDKVVKGAQ
jgi:hypothetical protein